MESLETRRLLTANGAETRVYRLAVAATEEYTAFYGGDRAAAQAEIGYLVGEVNEVLGRELNVRLDLLDRLDIVFGGNNPVADPYPADVLTALTTNQSVLDTTVGSANYDLGWVLGTFADGGRAVLGGAGVGGQKGKFGAGLAATPFGPGSPQYLDVVLHELGHFLGADHSFNSVTGSCGIGGTDGRVATASYEPGSGSTIMSYAGLCPATFAEPPAGDNLQNFADPYFHAGSLAQITDHLAMLDGLNVGSFVGVNDVPLATFGADHTIPARTPFALTLSGTDGDDPDADRLRYTIEQFDLGAAQSLSPAVDLGSGPLFRSYSPSLSDPSSLGAFTRTFPRLDDLLAGVTPRGEVLPTTSRTLAFRGVVRDGDGGTSSDDLTLTVVDTGTPFRVTAPNTAVSLVGGASTTVTWDVAGTSAAPISTSTVRISLSTDGGRTFPYVLATTPNDGSQAVTLPNLGATKARIRVEAVGNVYFDVSDLDFIITRAASSPGIAIVESASSTAVGERAFVQPATDSYTLALNTTPGGPVTILATADSQTEVSLDGTTYLPFVSTTRSDTTPVTLFVRALDDSAAEGAHRGAITHTITSSSDLVYTTALVLPRVVAQIADDERVPLVGVDFQGAADGTGSPAGWNSVTDSVALTTPTTFSNLVRETGAATTFDLKVTPSAATTSFASQVAPLNSPTVPEHQASLAGLDGVLRWRVGTGSVDPATVDFAWEGLVAGRRYNLYVFASEASTEFINQTVTITGAGFDDPAPFTQVSTDGTRNFERRLFVNDGEGRAFRDLESYAQTVTADGSGVIHVAVSRDDDVTRNRLYLAGLAIQEAVTPDPGIVVTTTGAGTVVTESGTTDTFDVTLASPPLTDVVLLVSSGDTGEATVSPTMLVFTPDTWSFPRTVIVTGVDDALTDGDQTTLITISVDDASSDDAYDTVPDQTVSVVTLDDETPISLSLTITAQIIEGSSGTLTVSRSASASWAAPLTVSLLSSDTSELSTPATVVIPAGEGSASVMVSGVIDASIDGPQGVTVSASAAGFAAVQAATEVVDKGFPFPWHNAAFPEDVDNSGDVSLTDIVLTLQDIIVFGTRTLTFTDPSLVVPPYIDVSRDNFVSIQDLVPILSFIILAGNGEGESATEATWAGAPGPTLPPPDASANATRSQEHAEIAAPVPVAAALLVPPATRKPHLLSTTTRIAPQHDKALSEWLADQEG